MLFSVTRQAKRYKLSTVMCGLAFCTFFFILAACLAIGYVSQKQSVEQQTLQLNEIHAKELSRITQSLIYSMQSSLAVTSRYIMSQPNNDTSAMQQQLDYFRKSNGYFNAVLIMNEQGDAQYSSPKGLYNRQTPPINEQTEKALLKRKAYISMPYSDQNGRLVIMMGHPMYTQDGRYQGMLAGVLYLEESNRLNELLDEGSKKEDGSYFYVVDNKANIIYHPMKSRIGKRAIGNTIMKELQDGRSGHQRTANISHVEVLAGYATVPGIRWGIVFQTPSQNTAIFSAQLVENMLFYLVPIIILLLMIIYHLAVQLSHPLNSLADYARSIGTEEGNGIPPLHAGWNYEAHELHQAIMVLEQQTREKERRLQKEAHYDALTGVLNRRALVSIMQNWIGNRYRFAVMMLDIDHFKSINDTYGHSMGDDMLKGMADVIAEQIHAEDLCFRYGGEEFVVLLYETDEEQGKAVGERIREAAEQCPTPFNRAITVSLGMTVYTGGDENLEELLEQADQALYDAKNTGRNKMVVYENETAISAGD
ncbi:sensor domain-containing diguanylate cyclase [Paenibacillus kandeliae]|uniref:sensor domain-containing diguanylate cyclase n=1 Tax=Paenibacillus kandeliae TaxID=3231269 RepID=UPI003459C742